MSKVFFSVSMSLDGFIAPEGMDMEHADDPTYKDWGAQWGALQHWVFQQEFFRKNLKLSGSGETGVDNRLLEETFNRTGVSILGKRMFEGGERFWPEEAPFHTPVFVLTHQVRSPWERPGGTTFYFVNDGIESALRQAREVVGDRDIRIAGGATSFSNTSMRVWSMSSRLHSRRSFLARGYVCLTASTGRRWGSRSWKQSTRRSSRI